MRTNFIHLNTGNDIKICHKYDTSTKLRKAIYMYWYNTVNILTLKLIHAQLELSQTRQNGIVIPGNTRTVL